MRFCVEVLAAVRAAVGAGRRRRPPPGRRRGDRRARSRPPTTRPRSARGSRRRAWSTSSTSASAAPAPAWCGRSTRRTRSACTRRAAVKRAVARDAGVRGAAHPHAGRGRGASSPRGDADAVTVVRALIADEAWAAQGARRARRRRSARCTGINQGCYGNLTLGPADRVRARTRRSGARTTLGHARWRGVDARSVVVVGGGPAGLEAAWVAAARGHDVVLLERVGAARRQDRARGDACRAAAELAALGRLARAPSARAAASTCGSASTATADAVLALAPDAVDRRDRRTSRRRDGTLEVSTRCRCPAAEQPCVRRPRGGARRSGGARAARRDPRRGRTHRGDRARRAARGARRRGDAS